VLYIHGLFYYLSYMTTYGHRDDALIDRSARSLKLLRPQDLRPVVLNAAQVGTGYQRKVMQNGDSAIGTVTLDLCDQAYASDGLRTARLQVTYTPPKGAPAASNEVVTYVPGGAQQALRELNKVVASCSKRPVVRTSGTTRVTFSVHRIAVAGLPPDAVAVRVEISGIVGKKRERHSGTAVYMVSGNTLSGIYTFAGNGATQADANRLAARAARASARALRGPGLTA